MHVYDGRDKAMAAGWFSRHSAADGPGAWTASWRPARLYTRSQAITAMVLAERLAAEYGDDDPVLSGWREEPGL